MTTYSDAAKAYAVAQHTDEHNPAGGFSEVCGHCKIAAKAYDAGRTDVPAPILLTAGDPRWRDGAKVRGEFADGSAVEGILIRREIRWGDPDYYYLYTGNLAAIYLLAEAPDPDADVVANLVCELVEIDDSREWTTVEARRILAVARADS